MTANSETVSLFVSSFSGLKHSERLRGEELVVLLLLLDNRNGLSLKAKANFQLGKPLRDFWCLAQSFLYLQKKSGNWMMILKSKSKGDSVNFCKKEKKKSAKLKNYLSFWFSSKNPVDLKISISRKIKWKK